MAIYKKKAFIKASVPKRAAATKVVAIVPEVVKSYVKSAITKSIEVKTQQFSTNTTVIPVNGTLFASVGIRSITPSASGVVISQGTGQGDRIGDSVGTKKVTLDMLFYPASYNATTNATPMPMETVVWILSLKENNTLPANLNDLFQNGNSTGSPNGSLGDLIKPINTDKYRLHKKVILKCGNSNYGGTGANLGYQTFNNNDYKLNNHLRLDLTKYCPKKILYNDVSGTPTSNMVFIAVECVPANGGTFAADQVPLNAYYTLSYDYTDA